MPAKSAAKTNSKSTTKKAAKKTTAKKAKKQAAKKAPAKKTAASTVSKASKTKKGSGKVLVCANDQECFWTTDGRVIADLKELEQALNDMADEVFAYHVNKERNDFADWVESVLRDAACAADLRGARKPRSARTVVVRHLKLYA